MKINIRTTPSLYNGPFGFLAQVIVMTLAVLLATRLMPGVTISSVGTAIATAAVIAVLNNFIRPILIVITLPFMLFTMGLFLIVINTVIILLADALLSGFTTGGFVNALIFSLLLTALNYLLEQPNRLLQRRKYQEHNNERQDFDGFAEYEDVTDPKE